MPKQKRIMALTFPFGKWMIYEELTCEWVFRELRRFSCAYVSYEMYCKCFMGRLCALAANIWHLPGNYIHADIGKD